MKTKIQIFLAVCLSLFLFLPLAARAADASTCGGFGKLFEIGGGGNLASGIRVFCTAEDLITFVINGLLTLAGTVAVLFIILGGFRYMTAAGNEEASESGRKILMNAVIGLVIVVMAAAIVRVVVTTLQSSGPSSSQNGSPSGGNSPTGSGSGNQVNFEKTIQGIPDSAKIGDTINATFLYTPKTAEDMAAMEEYISALCGGGAVTNGYFEVELEGQPALHITLAKNPTTISASIPLKVSGSAGKRAITTRICNTQISSGYVDVTGSSGSSAPDPAAVAQAVSRARISTNVSGNIMTVTLNLSTNDMNTICSQASSKVLGLYLNGQLVATEDRLNVRQFSVNLASGTQAPTVRMDVCGQPVF